VANTTDRSVYKKNPQRAKKTVATKRKEGTTTPNTKVVDTATRHFSTTDLPVVKTNAHRIKKNDKAVKKQQVSKSENYNVERADHQSTDRSVSPANHYVKNARRDEPGFKMQRKDLPLAPTNQHVANHPQRMDTTVNDPPVVTVNTQDTTMDGQVVVTSKQVDRKSREVIVNDPSIDYKNWATLSFSLSDPGSLGLVVKKLNLTNQTYALIKEVKAGSQAETAGIMASDIVVADYEEVLKWSKGPRPIRFLVLRNHFLDAAQEQAKESLHRNAERGSVPQKDACQAVAAALTERRMHEETAGCHSKFPDNDGTRVKAESLASLQAEVNCGEQKITDMRGQVRRFGI
jgi:hypothetical protein